MFYSKATDGEDFYGLFKNTAISGSSSDNFNIFRCRYLSTDSEHTWTTDLPALSFEKNSVRRAPWLLTLEYFDRGIILILLGWL